MELVDAMNLTPEQQALLAGIPDPSFRQTVRDFCVNQGFRKDFWVRGSRSLTPAEQVDGLRRQLVVLTAPRDEVVLKATGPQGEMILNEEIYKPILDVMGDLQARTIGELEKAVQGQKISFGQLVQGVMVLAGKGSLQAAQEPEAMRRPRRAGRSLM